MINSLLKAVLIILLITNAFNKIVKCENEHKTRLLNTQHLQGERILFIRKHNVAGMRLGDIYSMNSIGSDIQQITNFSKDLFITELPAVSNDGKKLTFISNYEEWKSSNYIDAFIADLNTGIFKRVTGYEKTAPTNAFGTVNVTVYDPNGYALTPSAIRISYSGCSTFITGNTANLTVPANEEIWVKAIVAKGKGDAKTVAVSEGGNSTIELDLSAGTISAESSSISFNGNYLAVSRNTETINFPWNKILIWDTNTNLPIAEVGGLKMGGDIFPAFSPDDSKLAFATGEPLINSIGIVSTDNVTIQPELIADGNILGFQAFCSQPTWSPNSSEIIFVYTMLNGLEIQSNLYKVSLNGGVPTQLTNFSGNEIVSKPSYSSDGTKTAFTYLKSKGSVFYLTDLINGTYISNIYSISSSGGNLTILTNDGNSLDPYWCNISTTVLVDEELIDNNFKLSQNYPNPFNPSTVIEFTIPNNSNVTLKVFDALGKEVINLVDEYKSSGKYSVNFDASILASGIYYYRLEADENFKSRKMVLLK
ncbi:MAG: T9SS type A sorting domain-containing protein [Ignavibacteriae bacterium]|nr:T9SS type A sorting domain-containing protein [Ignavibacteriota bacterium]